MRVTLICPNIVTQKGDFFGTGIPYFPLNAAYVAAYLRSIGHQVNLIDAFGENPFQISRKENKYIQGLTLPQIVQRIGNDTGIICIGAERLIAHGSVIDIIRGVQNKRPLKDVPIVVFENPHAVTAYSLQKVKDEFHQSGAEYVLAGEPERGISQLIQALEGPGQKRREELLGTISGLMYKTSSGKVIQNEPKGVLESPDVLPFPAWDLLTLENYWKLGYAHAPMTSGKFLPLLTSRGCPYSCSFCVVPYTHKGRWRPRSAMNVVDEMEFFSKKYGVLEYHIEDLNPTIRKERMKEVSREILKRGLKLNWKLVSGTKVETLDEETIQMMAQAGCSYISISPESGSQHILDLMNKSVRLDRALELVREMRRNNITSQACFILGFPGERKEDIRETNAYIKKIVKAGIDEIAVLILTPTPGSSIYDEYVKMNELNDVTKLTFTPVWRKDYKQYARRRFGSYLTFFFWKGIYHPLDSLKQPVRFILRRFNTKMEMTLYRVLKVWMLSKFSRQRRD